MIRVRPGRDARCPHEKARPYADTRYFCKSGWQAVPYARATDNLVDDNPPSKETNND